MAVFDSILSPAQKPAVQIAALGATTASSEQAMGKNEIFVIVSDAAINIRFGPPGNVATPTAADIYIPAGAMPTWDVGGQYTSFKVYNPGASSCNVWYFTLSKY